MNRLKVPIIALGAFALLLGLACGPAAEAPSNAPQDDIRVLAQEDPTAEPTPTPEEEPDPYQVKPTPTIPTLPPMKTPLPSEMPTLVRNQEHPEGLEGCKSLVIFQEDMSYLLYQSWCSEQLSRRVTETCTDESGDDGEARRCGEEIAREYRSTLFQTSVARCVGISDFYERSECMEHAFSDLGKALDGITEAWGKVVAGGNGDPAVGLAMKDTLACLADAGYEKVDPDLLFGWQRNESLSDHKLRESGLSHDDRKLRRELLAPTNDCAKQSGLYEAQDAAWAAELRRLDKTEPATVAILVQEGLLESLEKPGVTAYITGDLPQHLRDLDK